VGVARSGAAVLWSSAPLASKVGRRQRRLLVDKFDYHRHGFVVVEPAVGEVLMVAVSAAV